MEDIRSNPNSPREQKVKGEQAAWTKSKPAHKGLRANYATEYSNSMANQDDALKSKLRSGPIRSRIRTIEQT